MRDATSSATVSRLQAVGKMLEECCEGWKGVVLLWLARCKTLWVTQSREIQASHKAIDVQVGKGEAIEAH